MSSYQTWFSSRTGNQPWGWQRALGEDDVPRSKLIRIPTGFGKTLGVLAAWAYHRILRGDLRWPTRLVWTLPMRVLVEQTLAEAQAFLGPDVTAHPLMGGIDGGEWQLYPERPLVLVGTQDMILSRALNRGYGAARARWPIEHGLLNHDALWVMDEVQLMDVGLATSAQLQCYRDLLPGSRPAYTWWMSATLQPTWLESADTRSMVSALPKVEIAPAQRKGRLWDDVAKPLSLEKAPPADWPGLIASLYAEEARGRLALVVVNTVDAACELFAQLRAELDQSGGPELRLVHSRFRPHERRTWRDEFLRRDAPVPPAGRIIVATQVVEAGVDLDAQLLVSEVAPWPSLVQRFGRAARGGGRARVHILDRDAQDDKAARPYALGDLEAARDALKSLKDVSPASLERFEEALTKEERAALYPYEVEHLLLHKEWLELFDTTPDLTGADLDVSRFIRSGDERDVSVFWRDLPTGTPAPEVQPGRDELCPLPFLRARDWLFVKKSNAFNAGKRAHVWDWVDGSWRVAKSDDVLPGRILLVAASSGGYDATLGFSAGARKRVSEVAAPAVTETDAADSAQDREDQSAYPWRTIASHGRDTAEEVRTIGLSLRLDAVLIEQVAIAAQWHDLGKAHPAFQGSIGDAAGSRRPDRQDLAKAPKEAWAAPAALYRVAGSTERRRGFRHEVASALALFSLVRRYRPDHPGLLGPWEQLFKVLEAQTQTAVAPEIPQAIVRRVLELSGPELDLVAYLVMCHHGKVRMSLHAAPADQAYAARDGRGMPIRGVREGDVLPPVPIDADSGPLPALSLSLEPAAVGLSPVTGASWTERTQGLVRRHGPAVLALLEAWIRAADVRASRAALPKDPLIGGDGL